MAPLANVPLSDGKQGAFPNYAQYVVLRGRVATLDPVKRAFALGSQMDPVAREVCMAVGSDQILGPRWRCEDSAGPTRPPCPRSSGLDLLGGGPNSAFLAYQSNYGRQLGPSGAA